jgi:hypothetical protein
MDSEFELGYSEPMVEHAMARDRAMRHINRDIEIMGFTI